MDLRKVLVHSRKLPAQHIETLWENIYKQNVKVDTLSSILAFYMHHRVYPPPVQRAFDTLLIAFTGTKVPKRLRILLFQTVEEMCHWVNPSCITHTVKLSTSPSVVAELLPCFLINSDIPPPDTVVYEWLISAVASSGLSHENRAKVLGFLMSTVPESLMPALNKELVVWLSYSRTSQATGSLFRTPDVAELDGSPCLGLCTALSLVTSITDVHCLSLVTFSNIRRYLHRSHECTDSGLINAVFSYCSALLAQASKKPNSQLDRQLMTAVLEEVLRVMSTVRRLDISCSGRCQLMVGNVQHLAEQLRLSVVLISVWEYHLSLGEESSLTQKMLGGVVKSEFSQGLVSQRLAAVVADHGSLLAPGLAQYSPSLLKLAATHPSALVEEFLEIIPHLASNEDLVEEVLHCLLDLPTLSASICVHQSALLVQAGFKVPVLLSVKHQVETDHKAVFSHLMRSRAKRGETDALLKLYPGYWAVLRPILSLGLVEVCAQVTPLLLNMFLESVSSSVEVNRLVLPVLLARIPLLCPLPNYQKSIFDVLPQYISKVSALQPEVMESGSVVHFLSVTSHCQLCPQLFVSVVQAVGEHVTTEQMIVSFFETLDALLREILHEKTPANSQLEMSICTTLAKLASRHVSLIPRAITAFDKLVQTVQSSPGEQEEALPQQVKELIRILKNPRVASVVLSPTCKEDLAMAAIVRVLFQFLE